LEKTCAAAIYVGLKTFEGQRLLHMRLLVDRPVLIFLVYGRPPQGMAGFLHTVREASSYR